MNRLTNQSVIALVMAWIMALVWPINLMAHAPLPSGGPDSVEYTEQMVLDEQAEVFNALFDRPWSEEGWTYSLDQKITDKGVYTGTNDYGDPFKFDVKMTAHMDLHDEDLIPLTDFERGWAADHGFEYVGVKGMLSTDRAEVAVNGLVVFQSNEDVAWDSRLMVVNIDDETSPLYVSYPGEEGLEVQPPLFGLYCIAIPQYCVDPGCILACLAQYLADLLDAYNDHQAKIDEANAVFESVKQSEETARDAKIGSANSTYATTVSSERTMFAIELAACTAALTAAHIHCAVVAGATWWTFGLGLLACIVFAQAGYATCVGIATGLFKVAENAARSIRDGEISAANTVYDARMKAARDTLKIALDRAALDFKDAIEGAGDDLDDCLDDCEPNICGWWVICVVVVR